MAEVIPTTPPAPSSDNSAPASTPTGDADVPNKQAATATSAHKSASAVTTARADAPLAPSQSPPPGGDVVEVPPTGTSAKAGRRPKFTPAEDLVIVRDVSACKTHIAPYGEIGERFNTAAEKANDSPQMSKKLTYKSIQDKYKKLQDQFDKNDAKDRALSGVGGEIGELEELLGGIAEARDDIETANNTEKAAKKSNEEEKERIGEVLVAQSIKRKATSGGNGTGGGTTGGSGDGDGANGGVRRRRKSVSPSKGSSSGELHAFGDALKEAEMARIEVDRERLLFDRERLEAEQRDRQADRELQREERAARDKLELDKFKLLMEMFKQK